MRRALGLRVRLEMACVEVYGHEVSDLLQDGAAVGVWQGVAARAVAEGHASVPVTADTADGAPCEAAELEQVRSRSDPPPISPAAWSARVRRAPPAPPTRP